MAGSTWEGMRHREVGQAQAWYYPADRVLMIWECFFLDAYQEPKPQRDMSLSTLWAGFERTLLAMMLRTERVVTTWEDTYPRPDWHAFLERQGYAPYGKATFAKTP